MSATLYRCVAFLRTIGLAVEPLAGAAGFIDGVEIVDGRIFFDPVDCIPGNLLHEAGHLAILPSCVRSYFGSDLSIDNSIQGRIDKALSNNPDAERFYIQSGECEATAWAWAAGKHLGLSDDEIILDGTYDSERDRGYVAVRQQLRTNSYFGINGLQAAGWCRVRELGPSRLNGDHALPVYPRLAFWTAP